LELVTIRVDEQLKRRMERLSHVNWNEVIRAAISAKIREEEQRVLGAGPDDLSSEIRRAAV
jgi:predicted transcriptional regulator